MPFSSIKRLQYGSVNGFPDAWCDQGVRCFSGTDQKLIYGLAKLTDTLQTAIPIYIPSFKKDQDTYTDKPLILPANCQVNFLGFRLPSYWILGEETPYGILPRGCTIVGTNGEKLKVSPTSGTTYTQPSPAIVAANGVYAVDTEASAWRGSGVADAASPSILRTLSTPIALQITCSNAGDAAVGTGARLSNTGAEAYIVVFASIAQETSVPRLGELNLPIRA